MTEYLVSPSINPRYLATDPAAHDERPERGWTRARRYRKMPHVDRFDQRDRERQILTGRWPGFAAAVPADGGYAAVIFTNTGEPGKYRRRVSTARWTDIDAAYDAAERWLQRALEPR